MKAEGVHLVISSDVVDGRAIRVGVGRVLHHHVHEDVDPIQGLLKRLGVCNGALNVLDSLGAGWPQV